MHAMNIFGAGLDPHQNDGLAFPGELFRLVTVENDLAGGRARTCRQAAGNDITGRFRVQCRMQELIKRGRINPLDGLLFGDQTFLHHVDSDFKGGLRRPFAGPGLQHPQLALLHREFDVLHVAVMRFQLLIDIHQLLEDPREDFFHRQRVSTGFKACLLGQILWRADTGDHILALRIHQKFAIEDLFARGRVTGEGHTGRAVVAHIAEHHGLNIDGGAPACRNIMQTAIGNGALVGPAVEHRTDCSPELILDILREGTAEFLRHLCLILADQIFPVIRRKVRVEQIAFFLFQDFQQLFEMEMIDAEHDVGIHLDKAAVAVIGKPLVPALRFQPLHGLVIQAEVENGIHHARHGRAGAGADGDEKRLSRIAKAATDRGLNPLDRRLHLARQCLRIGLVVFKINRADFRGDGKARGDRQAEVAHFGEVCALAAKKIAHVGGAVRLSITKRIYPLRHLKLALLMLNSVALCALYRCSYAKKVKINLQFLRNPPIDPINYE